MRDYIEERATQLAYYIIEHKATVRQTAKAFNVSKSTAHKDVTRKVLDVNKQERHIRGGMATKEKYLHACAR